MNKKIKALVLFSGGLDSILAVKLLQVQGIEVNGVCFESNFFNCEKAKKAAEELGIKLKIVDISKKLLEIVKNPLSGYGKHLNPCIDCHSLMIKKAGEYLTPQPPFLSALSDGVKIRRGGESRFSGRRGRDSILATGEVLGQRPFSQTKEALARIEKLAGKEILRPLSAKKLPETVYEKQGLVNRGRLKDISGRSRDKQMELAEKYGLKNYSSPAGGCLLTDPEFSQRLLVMFEKWPECNTNDVELLKHGRVFWLTPSTPKNAKKRQDANKCQKVLIVVGRHKEDDERLEKLAKQGDIVVELEEIAGPLTLVRNSKFQIPNNKPRNIATRQRGRQISSSKFQVPNSLEIEVPWKLKMSELKLGEEKSEDEILQIAGLLTGYYAVKARGKKVKIEVTLRRQGSGGQGS